VGKKTDQPIQMIAVDLVDELPGTNPNVMDAETEAELEASVRRLGFRQAITVVRRGDRFLLSDGKHRLDLARRLGTAAVPAVVGEGDEATVRAERLALNRIRGGVDLGMAADELRALQEAGWGAGDLGAVGFSQDELEALLAHHDEGGLVAEAGEAAPMAEGSDVQRQKRYSLSLVFDREADRDRAKLQLLAAGTTAEAGLLALLADR
jgi:ParB-like chromosome segregation protein Spo0J